MPLKMTLPPIQILVVDDEPDLCALTKEFLEISGEIEVDTAPPQTAPTQVAQVTLPKTASPLPLIGLLGLLALGGAWAIGLVQKRAM